MKKQKKKQKQKQKQNKLKSPKKNAFNIYITMLWKQ